MILAIKPPGSALQAAAFVLAVAGAVAAIAPAPAHGQEGPRSVAVYTALNNALETQPSGKPVRWSDPRTGEAGTIVVEPAVMRAPKVPCRGYTRTMEVGGSVVSRISGTGCRLAHKSWSLTERPPERVASRPKAASTRPERAEPAKPAFTLTPPERKPVLIFATLPTPSGN